MLNNDIKIILSIKNRPSVRNTRTEYISEDMQILSQNYCIIFGQPMQAELLFPAGCYFYTQKIQKGDDFMPTARKLPSGSWRCQVFSHYEYKQQKDGSIKKLRIYESFTCNDPSKQGKKKAEAMAAEYAINKERMLRSDFTLKEAMEKYIDSKRNVLSPTTIRGYETLLRNAYTDLLNIKTKKITQQIIQEWVNKYSIGHAPKTVSNAHGFLSSVLGVYEPSIVLRTTLPEAKDPELYTPSDKEIERLLNYICGTEMEKAVLLAAFGTLRRAEICALTDSDIQGNSISVNKSMVRSDKGGFIIKSPKVKASYRTIEYPEFVIAKFKGIKGRLVKMHPEDISKKFGIILKEAGLPHFRFHDLRHYSASIMHAIGIPDQYIMDRGGWKTDRVLKKVYRNVISDEKKKFTQQINAHFESMQHEMQHDIEKAP